MDRKLINRAARVAYELGIDLALEGSFPASDPLPWTLGASLEPEPVQPDRITKSCGAADGVTPHVNR